MTCRAVGLNSLENLTLLLFLLPLVGFPLTVFGDLPTPDLPHQIVEDLVHIFSGLSIVCIIIYLLASGCDLLLGQRQFSGAPCCALFGQKIRSHERLLESSITLTLLLNCLVAKQGFCLLFPENA